MVWKRRSQIDVKVSVSKDDTPGFKHVDLKKMNRKALEAALAKTIERIDSHFDTRQTIWQPLAPMTQRERAEQGYNPTSPKLIRSGDLRRNRAVTFAYIKEQGTPNHATGATIIVGTKDPIAIDLNNGNPTTNLPARNFYRMDEGDALLIRRAFAQNFMIGTSTTPRRKYDEFGRSVPPTHHIIQKTRATPQTVYKQQGNASKKVDRYRKNYVPDTSPDHDIPHSVRENLRNSNLANHTNLERYASPESRARFHNSTPEERRANQYELNKEIYRNQQKEHKANKAAKEKREAAKRAEQAEKARKELARKNEIAGKPRHIAEAEDRGEIPYRDWSKFGPPAEDLQGLDFRLDKEKLRNKRKQPYYKSQYRPYNRKPQKLFYGSRQKNKPLRPEDFKTPKAFAVFGELHKSYPNLKTHHFLDALELQRAEDMHRGGLLNDEGYDTIVRNVLANKAYREGKRGHYASFKVKPGKTQFLTPGYLREEHKGMTATRTAQHFGHAGSNASAQDAEADILRSRDLRNKTVYVGGERAGWLDSLWNHHKTRGRGNFEYGKSSIGAAKPNADLEAGARSRARNRSGELSAERTVEYLEALENLSNVASPEDIKQYMPGLGDTEGIPHGVWTPAQRKQAEKTNKSYRQARQTVANNTRKWNRKNNNGE